MFDFEKLEVYKKSKVFNRSVQQLLKTTCVDTITRNQLKRASLSIVLNIAEGSGRKSKGDKRHFFVISRGSVFECVAILDIMKDDALLDNKEFSRFYGSGEELSKMPFAMIRSLE